MLRGVSLWAGWVFEPAGLAQVGFFGSCTGLVGDKRFTFLGAVQTIGFFYTDYTEG